MSQLIRKCMQQDMFWCLLLDFDVMYILSVIGIAEKMNGKFTEFIWVNITQAKVDQNKSCAQVGQTD